MRLLQWSCTWWNRNASCIIYPRKRPIMWSVMFFRHQSELIVEHIIELPVVWYTITLMRHPWEDAVSAQVKGTDWVHYNVAPLVPKILLTPLTHCASLITILTSILFICRQVNKHCDDRLGSVWYQTFAFIVVILILFDKDNKFLA